MPLWRTLSEPCRCCPPSARCRHWFPAMASPPGRMLTAPGACRSPAAIRRRGRDRSPRPKLAARSGRCGQRPAVRSRSPRPETSRPDPRRHGQRLAVRSRTPRPKTNRPDPSRRGQSWLSDPGRRRGYGGSRCHGAGGPAHRVVPLLAGRRGPRHAPLIGSRVPAPRSGAGRPATRVRSGPCSLTATPLT
jgi:hypothetical protein